MNAKAALGISKKYSLKSSHSLASFRNVITFIKTTVYAGGMQCSFKQNEWSSLHIDKLRELGYYVLEAKEVFHVYWDEEHVL